MIRNVVLVSFAVLLATFTGPGMAEEATSLQSLQQQVKALAEGQEQMQKDLAEIKRLLQQGARAAPGQQAFQPRDMQLGDVPYLGEPDAPVTLVEFSDYHCPFCSRHARTVMPDLIESYIDTGKVRFVMREYPITNLHPRAVQASEAALCARDQGDYWGMHDQIFANQRATTDEDFIGFAATLELDVEEFSRCMDEDRHMAQIRADQAEGQKLGVSGTPSFVIGLTDPEDNSRVRLTRFIRGAQALPTFTSAIDELLDEPAAE